MTSEERTSTLQELRDRKKKIEREIWNLIHECHHDVRQVGAEPKFHFDGSAKCSICNQYFGWWCPDSPDHVCHYYSHDGNLHGNEGKRVVDLVTGDEFILPEDTYPELEDETEDTCLFCGHPEERK